MASAGNRVILFRSLSLALCKLGELAVELPEAFLGFGEELDAVDDLRVAVGVDAVAAPTAAFKVLSNICKSFMASGPSLEGSLPKAANGENIEDIAAVFDEGVTGVPATADVGGGVAFGINNPGCNIANKLCCCAGVIANGFMDANAANDCEFVVGVAGVALGFGGLGMAGGSG